MPEIARILVGTLAASIDPLNLVVAAILGFAFSRWNYALAAGIGWGVVKAIGLRAFDVGTPSFVSPPLWFLMLVASAIVATAAAHGISRLIRKRRKPDLIPIRNDPPRPSD